jgi:hypothetical protein
MISRVVRVVVRRQATSECFSLTPTHSNSLASFSRTMDQAQFRQLISTPRAAGSSNAAATRKFGQVLKRGAPPYVSLLPSLHLCLPDQLGRTGRKSSRNLTSNLVRKYSREGRNPPTRPPSLTVQGGQSTGIERRSVVRAWTVTLREWRSCWRTLRLGVRVRRTDRLSRIR